MPEFCSPGSFCHYENGTGQCECRQIPESALLCNQNSESFILDHYCVTYNEKENLVEIGHCIYNTGSLYADNLVTTVYKLLPNNVSKLNEIYPVINLIGRAHCAVYVRKVTFHWLTHST